MKNSPIAKLVPPQGDKHWSFQVFHASEGQRKSIKYEMRSDRVRAAHPFLQGHDHNWIMVEFWTQDKTLAVAAAEHLASAIHLPLLDGDFTRRELGLEY